MNRYALLAAGFVVLIALAAARARLDRRDGARRVFDFLARLEIGLIVLLLASLVTLGTIQIIMRNAMHSGLLWADPFMRHAVLYLGAVGAMIASARMNHITIDVISRMTPARLKPLRRLLVYGATAIAAYLLAIAAGRLVIDERSYGEMAFLGIKTWVVQLILPVAFTTIAYRTLLAIFLGREPAEAGADS
ncbi:MAG TPA: TRAP transporter small permease [Candidatus Krumholzibacteria bacterium]|nr:TRAP transporter small permease [Candidatus Krumholzibacteria bacterium]